MIKARVKEDGLIEADCASRIDTLSISFLVGIDGVKVVFRTPPELVTTVIEAIVLTVMTVAHL